jgi:hypothetical protein
MLLVAGGLTALTPGRARGATYWSPLPAGVPDPLTHQIVQLRQWNFDDRWAEANSLAKALLDSLTARGDTTSGPCADIRVGQIVSRLALRRIRFKQAQAEGCAPKIADGHPPKPLRWHAERERFGRGPARRRIVPQSAALSANDKPAKAFGQNGLAICNLRSTRQAECDKVLPRSGRAGVASAAV